MFCDWDVVRLPFYIHFILSIWLFHAFIHSTYAFYTIPVIWNDSDSDDEFIRLIKAYIESIVLWLYLVVGRPLSTNCIKLVTLFFLLFIGHIGKHIFENRASIWSLLVRRIKMILLLLHLHNLYTRLLAFAWYLLWWDPI